MDEFRDFYAAASALNGLDVLDVEAMQLMCRVELAGEAFYEGIAAGVDNEDAAELFRRNGREERRHAERIGRAVALKLGTPFDPSTLEPLTVEVPESIPLELLPALVAGEVAGDAGYQRWADAEPDPEVQRLLRLNGREETIHSQRVTAAIEILNAAR